MGKYFMADTKDELQFGDRIKVDLAKETEAGSIEHRHIDCVFCPELVEILLEAGVIEAEEEEKKTFTIDFSDDDYEDEDEEDLEFLLDKLVQIENRLLSLETLVKSMHLESVKKRVKKDTSEKGK